MLLCITHHSTKTIHFGFEKVYGQGHRSGLNKNVCHDDNSSLNEQTLTKLHVCMYVPRMTPLDIVDS